MTKEEFSKVYDKHKPNYIVRLFYKHFSSTSTTETKFIYNILLLLSFIIGFISISIGYKLITMISTIIIVFLLLSLVLFGGYSIISNKIRIYKIRKELKISVSEYNKLVYEYKI